MLFSRTQSKRKWFEDGDMLICKMGIQTRASVTPSAQIQFLGSVSERIPCMK